MDGVTIEHNLHPISNVHANFVMNVSELEISHSEHSGFHKTTKSDLAGLGCRACNLKAILKLLQNGKV